MTDSRPVLCMRACFNFTPSVCAKHCSSTNKLRLIGIAATTQSDSHLQLIAATQLQKGDVAFGISCSGSTHETVQCLQIARENKATTLSVTNCMKSPITEHSDLVLYATPSE